MTKSAFYDWAFYLFALSLPMLLAYAGCTLVADGYVVTGCIVIVVAMALLYAVFFFLAPWGHF
jgi:hypothetical protein